MLPSWASETRIDAQSDRRLISGPKRCVPSPRLGFLLLRSVGPPRFRCRPIARATKPRLTCSTTLNASIIRNADTQRSDRTLRRHDQLGPFPRQAILGAQLVRVCLPHSYPSAATLRSSSCRSDQLGFRNRSLDQLSSFYRVSGVEVAEGDNRCIVLIENVKASKRGESFWQRVLRSACHG
jgi:hypothetical protein